MIELAIVKTIIDISKSLVDIAPIFSTKEQRKEVAQWMMNVGKLLNDLADQLDENQFPYSMCAKMQVYAEKFPEVVEDFMQPKDSKKIHALLLEAQNLERLYGELQTLDAKNRRECIKGIQTAAGTIIAHAQLMKIGH